MIANIITFDDLQKFKADFLEELVEVLEQRQTTPARKWLKSDQVRRLLTISPNTLHALRERGSLPYTKIGGVIYYDYDDIKKMLDQNKTVHNIPDKPGKPIDRPTTNRSRP